MRHSNLSGTNVGSITERCQQMAGLLKELRNYANAEEDARVDQILECVSC
jgi:hypothetical protein